MEAERVSRRFVDHDRLAGSDREKRRAEKAKSKKHGVVSGISSWVHSLEVGSLREGDQLDDDGR